MKKFYYLIITLVMISILQVNASTNVTSRTEDNLQINSDIKVTSSNIKNILNTPKVNEEEKIYDFANLLSETEELELFNLISKYIEKYDMDMVIVTIDKNDKRDEEEYADDFYDYNYFGKKDKHDGLLLLMDMDNRGIYIFTNGNAILMYDDVRINIIIDYMYDYMVDGDYYKAAKNFVYYADSYAKSGIPRSNDGYIIDENGNYVKAPRKMNILAAAIGGLITSTIVLIIFISKHKGIKLATEANNYINQQDVIFDTPIDAFVGTSTSTVKISRDRGSSGGWSGGSSTHSGSSGRSHGGGGRRF